VILWKQSVVCVKTLVNGACSKITSYVIPQLLYFVNVEVRAGMLIYDYYEIEESEPPLSTWSWLVVCCQRMIHCIDQLVEKRQLHPPH